MQTLRTKEPPKLRTLGEERGKSGRMLLQNRVLFLPLLVLLPPSTDNTYLKNMTSVGKLRRNRRRNRRVCGTHLGLHSWILRKRRRWEYLPIWFMRLWIKLYNR